METNDFCRKLVQGANFDMQIGAIDDAGKFCRFAGYEAAMQLRTSPFATEAVDTLTTRNKRITLNADGIHWDVVFGNDVTRSYPAGKLYFDFKVKSMSGKIYSIFRGEFNVVAGVTNDVFGEVEA